MTILGLLVLAVSTSWTVLGLIAVIWVSRVGRARGTPPIAPAKAVPVSVLKPLRGADSELEENLETFFAQDYSNFELVFGVVDDDDPAIGIVQGLMARYPNVACKLIVHRGSRGLNPKVSNLMGIAAFASHDLMLVSDSNVRAPRHYLRELVGVYEAEQAGLVTNLFAGSAENTLGSALENVQLNGFCAAGSALPTLLGNAAIIGKSTLFSRRIFESLGGFPRLADVLAEDFVLGKMFELAGLKVVIAPTVLESVSANTTVLAFLRRQLRWGMLRWNLLPAATMLEPIASPLLVLPLAWALFGPAALGWAIALWWIRDVGGWLALRGPKGSLIPLLLAPARDLVHLILWVVAALKRHVSWRGNRLRIASGTLLFARAPGR
jgi:ceramide glucosyltransferase